MLHHLQPLIDRAMTRSFTAGSTILYQGEVPRHAYIITKGVVKVMNISPQGDEQIVMYHVSGEPFPSSWIFGKTAAALFFYEAVKDTTVALLERDEMINYMTAQPERARSILDYFTTNYSASLIHVNALEQSRARDKLLHLLFFLCQRYGVTRFQKVNIPFALTHQNIASLVGLTRETTATEMSRLKKEKVLTYRQQHYVVDLDRLIALIGEESLKNLHINVKNPPSGTSDSAAA